VSCNFNLDLVRIGDVNEFLHPATSCIIKSVSNLQQKFWKKHENFLMAPITDNIFFLRAKPERRARNAGFLDRNFFGAAFYDRNKEALRALRLNNLLRNGTLIDYDMLVRTTGIHFTAAQYLNLQTACHFAVQKYGGKNGSNGSALPLNWLFQRIKKGSRLFRITIDWNPDKENVLSDLRVVKTFFELTLNPVPEFCFLKILYGSWNWYFLGNKIRSFCFQYYNNSLSIGARLAARYEHSNIIVDSRCTFCVKSKSLVPNRETFLHLFYDCNYITNIVKSFSNTMLREEPDEGKARLGCLTGLYENVSAKDAFLCFDINISEFYLVEV